MAITQNTATGNGSQTNYTFTFPYIEEDDVKVSLDGVDTTAYTFANATTIQFNSAPGVGVAIRIYRETDDTDLSATFYPGSAIRSQDLNDNFNQALYVAQETRNTTIQASTGNLADGSITSNLIANGAVSADKLGTNAVTEAKLANTAVTTTKLADSAVTAAKIADSAVTTAKIVDSNVTTAKIADANVTEAKLSFTPLKSTDLGVTVQAYDADTAKLDVAQTFTAQQTFAELKETVYTLGTTGSIALDPANGSIQSSVLTGAPTFTDSLEAGQTIVLMLEGGATYTVTWPTITWVTSAGNAAPTLTAKDTLVLWKVSTTLYGAYVGSYV